MTNSILENAWSVYGIDSSQRVDISKKGLPLTVQEIPTIIKHSQNSAKTTAEHIILTDTQNIVNVVRLSETRMAKYIAISVINCNLQIETESDLKPTFDTLYPFILDYSTSREFKDSMDTLRFQSMNQAKEIANTVINGNPVTREELEAQQLYQTIKNNYSKLQNPSKSPEQYLQNILFDRIHMKAMEKVITKDLEPKLIAHATTKNLGFKSLTQRVNDRTTYFFAGAPASGKGTTVALRRREYIKKGKNWADMVKINTDSHRDFIIDSRLTTQKIEAVADLNHEEASLISDISQRLYESKVASGKAADMLVDAVSVKKNKLDLALKNGGQVIIDVVIIPAEKCVERAYSRGLEEKRYVPTSFIIQANASVAKEFHNIISNYSGKKIEYRLFDNDVERGRLPILIETGDLEKRSIEVIRPDLLNKFLDKVDLNHKAQNIDQLYGHNYGFQKKTNLIHTGINTNQSIKVEYKNRSLIGSELQQSQVKNVMKNWQDKIKNKTLSNAQVI